MLTDGLTLNLHLVTTTNFNVWSFPKISSLHKMSSCGKTQQASVLVLRPNCPGLAVGLLKQAGLVHAALVHGSSLSERGDAHCHSAACWPRREGRRGVGTARTYEREGAEHKAEGGTEGLKAEDE